MQIDQAPQDYAAGRHLPAQRPALRTAVIHEWLTIPGGSEKVVEAILEMLPNAELFTSIVDPERCPPLLAERRIHTTFLNRIPGAQQRYTYLMPLMDTAFRSFDLSAFDLVVSSNHASAKNVRVAPGTPHVCYCHTPMRYAWDASFLDNEPMPSFARHVLPPVTAWLRWVDRRRSAGPDVYAANSTYVAERIARVYGRSSEVIHPPVDVAPLLGVARDPTDAYLIFGRVVPYKRVDLAVEACRRLGRRVIVAGSGRDLDRVRALAGSEAEFTGHVSDAEARELLASSRALLFPGLEDFGMIPVEAQAAGLPVIAYGQGGVRDSVTDGVTGVLYPEPTVESLMAAIERFETMTLDEAALRDNARRFAPERFRARFAALLNGLTESVGAADTVGDDEP